MRTTRFHYRRRPHSALGYRPPEPEAKLPRSQALDTIPSVDFKDPESIRGWYHSGGKSVA